MAAKKKVSKSKKVSKPKVEKLGILTARTEFTELKEQFNDFKGWATHEIVKLQKRVGELEDGVATLEETRCHPALDTL